MENNDIAKLHEPVMMTRCVELLAPALSRPGSVYVDSTTGMGGHAEAILEACPEARLIGIDRDEQALELAGQRLRRFGDRVTLVHAVYDQIADVVDDNASGGANAILFDLGVSSLQLDERARGFAYSADAPLDMRMDRNDPLTARDVVNEYGAAELMRIMREYGEEQFAPRIARAIVARREVRSFETTADLAAVIASAVPRAAQAKRGHPAKRVFQAIRIEVNHELDAVRAAIPAAIDVLVPTGRLVVLAYHSLEDRIVKRELAAAATSRTPKGIPVDLPGDAPRIRLLTHGAEKAGADETTRNPRSASVRLRAAEKLEEAA